ncbi:MAG TPA: hypothetical protein VLM85_13120, partial [Polyangiaceae bacterium]|nr:hypothetical protein [Polyangiaceae bacterium]
RQLESRACASRMSRYGLVIMGGLAPIACGDMLVATDGGLDPGPADAPTNGSTDAPVFDAIGDTMLDGDDAGDSSGLQIAVRCGTKQDCTDDASTPICCATLSLASSCALQKISATCASPASCPTTLQPFCGGDEVVRLCESNATCTEPSFDKCCTFPFQAAQGGAYSLVMCASQQMANAADASCLP